MSHEKSLDFEQALERLEEIIGLLEDGNLKLEEALELYNEGVTLVKECSNFITKAKNDVKVFLVGEGTEIPWDVGKE